MALTKIDDRGLKTPIGLIDNEKIRLGTGNDLEIYHDGTDSIIKAAGTATPIKIQGHSSNASTVHISARADKETIKCLNNSNAPYVELYHNNVKKLETVSGGINVAGYVNVQSSGQIYIEDGGKLNVGTDNDLQIYHSNSASANFIETGSQIIHIQSDSSIRLQKNTGGENMLIASADGAVNLYYDGSLKLATSADGTSLTGNATVAGTVGPSANATYNLGYNSQRWNDIYMKNDMFINDDGRICWGDGNDLQIYHSGVDSVIDKTTSDGNLLIYVANDFYLKHGTEVMLAAKDDGAVDLYHNGTQMFYTTASGCHIGSPSAATHLHFLDGGIARFGAGPDLEIHSDGTNAFIKCPDTGNNLTIESDQHLYIKTGDSEDAIRCVNDGAVELYHNGTKRFETTSTGFGGLGMLNAGPTSNNGYTYHDIRNSTDDQWLAALRHTTGTSPYGIWLGYTDASPDQNGNEFCRFDDSTAQRFRVNSDGDIYTHDSGNINSDQTMKENIVDASPKLDDLMKLKVRNFTWKKEFHPAKEGQKKIGFIAQEVEEVFPKLVTENNIAPLGKPDVIKKEIKQAWAPILVKALQEAVTKIETLETKVAALEAA